MISLRDALTQYVALRRALGTQLQEPARTLVQFLDFLEHEGAEFITSELALRWAMEPKGVQRATWARRLCMVRRFAAWLTTIDARNEVPPPRLLAARRRRNKPHIFTKEQIDQLMAEAARLPSPTGLRALTYTTLIGLLTSTGLRPGEALALDRSDVDLANGILAIRQTNLASPVSCRSRTQHAPLLLSMQSSERSFARGIGPRLFLSPNAANGSRAVLPAALSPGCPALSACGRTQEPVAPVVDRGSRIFVTVSQRVSSLNGIARAWM